MGGLTADEIVTQKHKRNYVQFGGPRPNNVPLYAGQDGQYFVVEGVSEQESGGVDPIRVPDPLRQGKYRLIGRKVTPADLAGSTIKMYERHGSIPRQLRGISCPLNVYEATGACGDLSNFLGGWSDYVLIYSQGNVTDKDLGDRSSFDADDAIEDSLSVVWADIYPVGSLGFGEQAATQVDREVVDIHYGGGEQCGDCGPTDDGTQKIYAITASSGAGSPGLPAELIYSIDGGANWSQASITGIGATADPVAIDIVGDKVVILTKETNGAIYYATLSELGVPGTFTKVTTGFVATHAPNDIYVANPREVYICGDLGYVYKTTDITAGVNVLNAGVATASNLLRIHGKDDCIVSSGASGAIIKSINRGVTFATMAVTPSGLSIRALACLDARRCWVGTSDGRVFYTLNGGSSWTELTFTGYGTGQVFDIQFATDEVGFISHSNATPTAALWCTWNGGKDWTNTTPRLANWPTFNRGTRVAIPRSAEAGIASNTIAIGGLAGGGVDGIILIGAASVV